ncbi:MAG TPA: phosphate acyltransferase PlsX [Candidatus Dormibacteraeota bacterium]|nr:phosphate acyltransferase PlsX [Candidatus Dormibacteraeota bacterium]
MPIRIAVDGMGGDHAPAEIVSGAALAAAEYGCEVTVVGAEADLRPLLAPHPALKFLPATEVIAMDDHPAQAVRQKRDNSMSVCARLCKAGDADGWCSAGNSGAILAAALFGQGRIKGVERPALGTIVPTASGFTYFLDVGANVDSRPEFLVQQAQMGTVYARSMLGRAQPRVGLLSNGEEASKGDALIREVYPRLERTEGINFIGNVEGKDLLAGKADVVVADGFVGNVAIKMMEATADFLFRTLRDELPKSPLGLLGGLLIRGRVRSIRARIDWREFGGAPLLGIDGVAVVAHGRSDARAMKNAIRVTREAAEQDLVGKIKEAVGQG